LKRWTAIDKSTTPNGGIIQLDERDGVYYIRVNGKELMSTRKHSSEETLADLTCRPLLQMPNVKVLIGGLGFGFTLRAALAALGDDAQIVVAELIPAVVTWNRNPQYKLAFESLADKRVQVIEKDVQEVIRSSHAQFDVILLDVDNGPSALCAAGNQKLYFESGLHKIKTALRMDGCLGVWSATDDPAFLKRMRRAGFVADVKHVHAYGSSGQSHTLFIGRAG
jgi:spermidine synthase